MGAGPRGGEVMHLYGNMGGNMEGNMEGKMEGR
jgi:hypothetical protein